MTEKLKRGFALLDPKTRQGIASDGGRIAHAKGTAHEWTREQASAAARKMHENRRAAKQAKASGESA